MNLHPAKSAEILATTREYRDITELEKCAGTHFDPEIVAVFVSQVIGEKS